MLIQRLRGYIFPNIFAMVGTSLYILVDTYFISAYAGTNGMTALNLVLPVYSTIFAIGSMLGNGSATAYSLTKAAASKNADMYFSGAVLVDLMLSIPLVLIGLLCPEQVMMLLGADRVIVETGRDYISIVLLCTPFFLVNYAFTSFVRNDGAPNVAMAATIISSVFNIVFDYVLIFMLDMGMAGAALATGLSPVVSMGITMVHFLSKKNTIRFRFMLPKFNKIIWAGRLGIGYFIGEVACGVTGFVFNTILLGLHGNVAVAAYGIVSNISVVGMAVFSGISQGLQPMASEAQGVGNIADRKAICKYALKVGLVISAAIVGTILCFANQIVSIFNSEQDMEMAALAVPNLQLYILGFLPSSANIILCGYLGAIGRDRICAFLSVFRGVIAITAFAFVLSGLFGIFGVWIAYPSAELLTLLIAVICMIRTGL